MSADLVNKAAEMLLMTAPQDQDVLTTDKNKINSLLEKNEISTCHGILNNMYDYIKTISMISHLKDCTFPWLYISMVAHFHDCTFYGCTF